MLHKIMLSVIITFFLSGCMNPFKAPMNEQQNIAKWIGLTEQHLQKENWQEAKQVYHQMKKGWKEIHYRVSLNASSDDIANIDISLQQLKIYIEEQEKVFALAELVKIKQIWEEIANL